METTIVAIRVRPIPPIPSDPSIWDLISQQQIQLNPQVYQEFLETKRLTSRAKTAFKFDHCFSPQHDNPYVYETVVKHLVVSSLKGINGSLFMYGQTGSGKTYTMLGQPVENALKENEKEEDNDIFIIKTPRTRTDALRRAKTVQIPSEDNIIKTPRTHKSVNLPGVLNLALKDLFQAFQQDNDRTFLLRVSYIEIYNENVYDLLNPREKLSETLQINEDPNKGFYIKGVIEETVNSIDEVLEKLVRGEENRHYAQTVMNHTSSRSHTVFRLIVRSISNKTVKNFRKKIGKDNNVHSGNNNVNNKELLNSLKPVVNERSNILNPKTEDESFDFHTNVYEEGTVVSEALMNFVDLGGSEKVSNLYTGEDSEWGDSSRRRTPDKSREKSKSPIRIERSPFNVKENVKERVKEGQYINKSLFFLTQVLAFKTENKDAAHIPYRNSALTKILKSSLSGNSRILIVCCVTPALSSFDHTMSTLRFGVNAKRVIITRKLGPNVEFNNDDEGVRLLVAEYEKKIEDMEKERRRDREMIIELKEDNEKLKEENENFKNRLSRNNAKNALIYLKNMPRSYKKEFLDQMREDTAHMPANGMIFMTQHNKKYGLIDPEKKSQSLKNNWQDLIFDYQGSFALENFKRIKEINKLLMEKLLTLKERFEVVSLECLIRNSEDLERGMAKYRNIMKVMYQRFKKISEEFQRNSQDYFKCLKRLEIFEKYENLNTLSENELEKLEKHLLKGFDIVKDERFRRKYEKEFKNYSQISHQSTSDAREKQRKKNYENILKIIENFLDFDQIQAEIDFEIEEDFEDYQEKETIVKVNMILKEKLHKIFEEIMNDGGLKRKIEEINKAENEFHRRFELKTNEKKYEDIGLFEDTVTDSFLENFVDDKEFLGENLNKFIEKTPKINFTHQINQIISPLEKQIIHSNQEIPPPKLGIEKKSYNSYEDLLENLNASFKNDEEERNENIFENNQKGDDVSFEDRSQKEQKGKEEKNDRDILFRSPHEDSEPMMKIKKEIKKKETTPKKTNMAHQAGKLSVSVSTKNLVFDKTDISLRASTPHKLQKPDLRDLNSQSNTNNTSRKTKTPTPSKQHPSRAKSNASFSNMPEKHGFLEEAFKSNDSDKNQRLLIIDETKIKTEGEDTLFSASIFEDDMGSPELKKNSGEDGRGWLFEDERKVEVKRTSVKEKKTEEKTNIKQIARKK